MKKLSGILIIFSLLVWSGCSSTRVHSDQVKDVNFSAYKTYAWLPNGKDTTSKTILNSEITYQNLRQAADREMAKRGYTLDAQNPDLLLLVHTMFEKRQELVQSPLYSSYGYYYPGFYTGTWHPYYYGGYYNVPYVAGYDIREVTYTEGTVIIDVIDRKKNNLIWRGWSEERIHDYGDVNELYKNVEKIFKKYPVKAKK
jgi:hypothetical protein